MVSTNQGGVGVLAPQIWITAAEVRAIFKKHKRSVEYAAWKDKVKARQCVVGSTWLFELNSCIALWGQPVRPEIVEQIIHDIANA